MRGFPLHHHRDCLAEDPRGAELDEFRPRVVDRRMTRRDVVGVAGLVGLLAIGEAEAELPLQHVTPAGQLGPIVGEAAEQVLEVGVGRVRLETDGVATLEVLQPDVDPLERDLLRRCLLGYLGHLFVPPRCG
jgi:hypothetical protein